MKNYLKNDVIFFYNFENLFYLNFSIILKLVSRGRTNT